MAGRDWYWWLDSQPTQVTNFYRVEIDVAASEEQRDQPLYTLVAFLSADLRADPRGGRGRCSRRCPGMAARRTRQGAQCGAGRQRDLPLIEC